VHWIDLAKGRKKVEGFREHTSEPSCSIKWVFFLLAAKLLASQEELFSPAPKTILNHISPYITLVSALTIGNLCSNLPHSDFGCFYAVDLSSQAELELR
jgi:hypothetical protein